MSPKASCGIQRAKAAEKFKDQVSKEIEQGVKDFKKPPNSK